LLQAVAPPFFLFFFFSSGLSWSVNPECLHLNETRLK
jgi:hypothetical protein